MFWVCSGRGCLELESGQFPIQSGPRLWLITLWERRSYLPAPGQALRLSFIHFGGPNLDAWLEELDVRRNPEFRPADFVAIRRARSELLRLLKRQPAGWERQVHNALHHIMDQLLVERKLLSSSDGMLSTPIARAVNLVSTNPKHHWKAKDLARLAGVGYSVLRALFHDQAGETIHEYLQRIRLDHARVLLLDQTQSIKSVADEMEFSSEFSFSHFFHQQTGVSPTQFRQRHITGSSRFK